MRTRGVGVMLVTATVLAVGLLPFASAQTQVLTTVRVAFTPLQSWAPIFIAQEEEYFRRQGMRVELIPFAGAAENMAPLIGGQLDVGAGAVSAAFFNALARGIPVRVVADKGHVGPRDRTNAIVVRKDLLDGRQVKSMADLRGKRIAINVTGGTAHYVVVTALRQQQMKESDVQLLRMPQPAIVAALENGAIEAGLVAEPYVTLLEERGTARVLLGYSDVVPGLQVGVLIYGPNLLQRDRGLGLRFMTAYLQGVRRYNEGKTQRNVEIQAKHTQIDAETLRKSYWFPISPDGRVDAISLMKMQDWMFEIGLISVRVPPTTFVDHSFVEQALELPGR